MWTFYYDGRCGFCSGSARWLRRLDWLKGGRAAPWQTLPAPPGSLAWADLDAASWVETGGGRLLRGFFALRWLAWRLPALWPLAPLLWLPGMAWLGPRLYAPIARRRSKITWRCLLPDLRERDG